MNLLKALAAVLLVAVALVAATIYSGLYPIGADEPHWPLTSQLIEETRDRAVAAHASGLQVPSDLASVERQRRGAGNYDAMCTGCHLKPGMQESEIREGLYPQPPNLAERDDEPDSEESRASRFWTIKHGLKLTAMPAWSRAGVNDETIWDLVAFIEKLPRLSAEDYHTLVESSAGHTHAGAQPVREQDEVGEGPVPAHSGHHHPEAAPGAAATVDAFGQALLRGDAAEAQALLAPEVLIYESGGQEASRAEYARHHLAADIGFMAGATIEQLGRQDLSGPDLATVTTRSRIRTRGAKPLDLLSTETMALKRTHEGWRIVHIHWSSQPYKPGN